MDNPNFEAGWNLAASMIADISNYIRNGRNAFLSGNLDKYYWNFNSIVRSINPFIDDEEFKITLGTRETDMENLLLKAATDIKVRAELIAKLKKYDETVMGLLHKYKFLVPPKEDRKRLIG